MKVTVKKLWHGNISIRDYKVEKAIENNEPIIAYLQGTTRTMVLSPAELKKGEKDPKLHRSKWGNTTYHLIDYPFIPSEQLTLV